jgi:polysaccharide deacetylase 2 family uncharacterized protein YibQ
MAGWTAAVAETPIQPGGVPAIALIIDDMGYRGHDGERALALPGALTYSFLPHTPAAYVQSRQAAALGKDVLLHLPMEAETGNDQLGPGAVILGMTREQVLETLNSNFASVPDAIGINNHMGSLLTAEREPMRWVMAALKQRGNLMYVDSRTTARTVAAVVARDEQVPFLSRDVFLDNEPGIDYVRSQFHFLIETAKQNGTALAIGHPQPNTLKVLEEALPDLHRFGVRLVRLPELLVLQQRSTRPWQLSSSHSPKAVRN